MKTNKTRNVLRDGWFCLTVFLTAFFRFEGIRSLDKEIKLFNFDLVENQDMQAIHFRNEIEAKLAHVALSWFANTPQKLEGNMVIVNFLDMDFYGHRSKNIAYCLPPKERTSIKGIARRARRVFSGQTPIIEIICKDSFKISYSDISTTKKFFELIKEMNWNCELISNNQIICYFDKLEIDQIMPEENNSEAEDDKVISHLEEKQVEVIEDNLHVIPFVPVVKDFTKVEVLEELYRMYHDNDLWSQLSSQTQEQIIVVLRKDFRDKNPEVYARYLLNIVQT